jgi:hypothetical protein
MGKDQHAVDVAERREAPRAELDGRYSMRLDPCDGSEPLTCPVLDFSVTGVRLKLPQDVALPAEVRILIGNIAHDAKIVWRKDDVVGVDLIDEHHSIY